MATEHGIDAQLGGAGGVYLFASPGELVIEVAKRDRHRKRISTHLRAILLGPDRQVLGEVTIPDDGKPDDSGIGPVQVARLATTVPRKGVYALNITISQDRYGNHVAWGFRTNCPRYLIETSRGHRDARREEPIVLLGPDEPRDVCFMPRGPAFDVQLRDLPRGSGPVTVHDAAGNLIQSLEVSAEGKVSHTFQADVLRQNVPWRLHLPAGKAVVHIDGVTRWEKRDIYDNLPCWTPDLSSWFPFLDNRWLLTPYSRVVHGEPGETGEVSFAVHNNAGREQTVRLALEMSAGPRSGVSLASERVTVPSKRVASAVLKYVIPPSGTVSTVHLRATPEGQTGFSTYSTVILKAGAAPATRPLELPIVLEPYRHENEQFGYLPDYPTANQVYFDVANRPVVRTPGGIAKHEGGKWTPVSFSSACVTNLGAGFGTPSTKIAFDRDNDMYVVSTIDGQPSLLHSTDGGTTFRATPIPGPKGSFDIEQFSGHNTPSGPPPFVRYHRTASDPRMKWRRINDLDLFVPRKTEGGLVLGDPIRLSDLCIGLSAHSGIPSSIVSRGSRVHVTWGEATEPEAKAPGVPALVVTYDRETGKLGKPTLVGYGPPANDIHNSPCITIDSKGFLHVLVGTHGATFKYSRSLEANDASSGWTPTEDVGPGLRQTYVGLVCDQDDNLHLVFRLWMSDRERFPGSSCAVLARMRKRPGRAWEAPVPLVRPPFSEYSIFYHRLTIDRAGALFLSYDYWSTYWFYRTDHRGKRRALITSSDGGSTWKMAESRDLVGDVRRD